jgi:ADP-ribose pyrophosphatase YjhB (NUDIX family)
MATAEYYNSLPMKRMGSGALFFDSARRILIVKPSYKDVWEIPGGVVEYNESPRKAAEREIQEELNLSKHLSNLLCVDYQDPYDIKTESLMFIFDGGILSDEEIKSIKLDSKELLEFRFVTADEASKLLSPVLARRTQQSVAAKTQSSGVYLENRELVSDSK